MKIAITGHTSGIGLSLSNAFLLEKHDVIGFSRRTGYDIGIEDHRNKIIQSSNDCDIFVNNAWHITGQLVMLEEILNLWKGTEKCIINVSSNIKVLPESFFSHQVIKDYRDSKQAIDNLIDNYIGTIKILNVLPELTHTNFNLGISGFDISSGMDPEYVADLIYKEFSKNPDNKEFVIKHWQWLKHAN